MLKITLAILLLGYILVQCAIADYREAEAHCKEQQVYTYPDCMILLTS